MLPGTAVRLPGGDGVPRPSYDGRASAAAGLSGAELAEVYAGERYAARHAERLDPAALRAELVRIRRNGVAVNSKSGHGLVAALSAASRSLEASLGGQDHALEPEEDTR
jgi:hypothetical protein